MAIDHTFMVHRIQKMEQFYVAYGAGTRMPFVTCDEESGDDQVWIFSTEDLIKEFAKQYTDQKIPLQGLVYKNEDFLKFFTMLYTIGVNGIVFTDEGSVVSLPLEQIVKRPDFSQLPANKRPLLNETLQLTGIYFLQEATRAVPVQEKTELKELEEEFSSNLVKARLFVPVELQEGEGSVQEKLKNNQYKIFLLKGKDGEVYQPLFTDNMELEKFYKKRSVVAIALPFTQLGKTLTKEAKGYRLNPAGYNILITRENIANLPKRFQ